MRMQSIAFGIAAAIRRGAAWVRPGLLAGLAGVLGMAARGAVPTADGLYAVFQVQRGNTPVGEFTCRLAFDKVPRTVANFVGLAEGSLPFVDFKAGRTARRPFYDGITFHRVVPNFVIQGGSPNGLGTDGPGYTFRDEFDPTLRHSKSGILSMANSGLNSNGSQFFVTLAATPWLDDVHTVFGEVVDGLAVYPGVAQGDVITSVRIVRNGTAANAFVAAGHGVPDVGNGGPMLQPTPAGFQLVYPHPANSEFIVFHSDDLSAWSRLPGTEMYGPAPSTGPRDVSSVTTGKASNFFGVARVQYPDPILTPASVSGKRITLSDAAGYSFAFSLTNATSGTYVFTQGTAVVGPQSVASYAWTQEAYRGRYIGSMTGLAYGVDPIVQSNVSLVFSTPTSGVYAGNLSTLGGQSIPLSGSFAVSGL